MSDIIKTQQGFARKAETDRTHRFEDLYHVILSANGLKRLSNMFWTTMVLEQQAWME
jgi:hypothetical protein